MSAQPAHLVVVGASAGGVEALREFVGGLPADLPAAVLVVLHLPPGGVSALAPILGRVGPLRAVPAQHGAELRAGMIFTAVPDHHLLVRDSRIAVSRGPTENGYRPGIDALFRSAAIAWGPRVAGVVLSGTLDDGTAGLSSIKSRGGLALVQEPKEALYRGMPDSALTRVSVDGVLPAREIGTALGAMFRTRTDLPDPPPPTDLDRLEARIDAGDFPATHTEGVVAIAAPSGLSCPDCNGSLYTVESGRRYRCRVGHSWTAEALLQEQGVEVEKALWTALRALEEKRQLADRMCADARHHGHERLAQRYAEQGAEQTEAADVLRGLLLGDGSG
jgi:two-component system chemotaxis response regulator CheB